MNYNIKDIEKYFNHIDWNYNIDMFSEDDADEFVYNMEKEIAKTCDYAFGASKLVIVPYDLDYVIKIPFNCVYDLGEVYPFTSVPFHLENYCQAEEEIYELAKEEELEKIFLPIEYVGEIKTFPVYIQQKASDFMEQDYSSAKSREIILKERNANQYFIPSSLPFYWVASCLDQLGSIEKLRRFFYFLENENVIHDLHPGNIGYCNQCPVIIDYGGYFENY